MYATKVTKKSEISTSKPKYIETPLIGGRTVVAPTPQTFVTPTNRVTVIPQSTMGVDPVTGDPIKYMKGRITNVTILSDPKLFIPRTGLTNLVDGP